MGPAEQPPEAMIAFVARQLGVRHVDFANYAQRDQTRREHAVELQRYLGLRSFGLMDWRACLRVGADAAWATDRGEPIVQAMLAHLRISGVVLPPATVLERIGLAARARARKKTFEALAAGLSEGPQALHGRETHQLAAACAVDRRHHRNGGDPQTVGRVDAAESLHRGRRSRSVRHSAQAGVGRGRKCPVASAARARADRTDLVHTAMAVRSGAPSAQPRRAQQGRGHDR